MKAKKNYRVNYKTVNGRRYYRYFDSLQDATSYCNGFFQSSGIVLAIEATEVR